MRQTFCRLDYTLSDGGNGAIRKFTAQVIEMLREQFMAHREIATEAMLQMMGQDDLFAKALIDASIQNMDRVIERGLPDGAAAWLGMLGFRVIINTHGEVVGLDMPEQYEEFGE